MKRVTLELVTLVEVVTPAADDQGAITLAEAQTRLRFPGKGYSIRAVKVEETTETEPSLRWRLP